MAKKNGQKVSQGGGKTMGDHSFFSSEHMFDFAEG